jgi:hypothetical protein
MGIGEPGGIDLGEEGSIAGEPFVIISFIFPH